MTEKFISEAIRPDPDSFDLSNVPVGEPAFPTRFTWRGKTYAALRVIEKWKESGPDRTHGSGEMYVRKHWFHIETENGDTMKIYCERQPRSRGKSRWWLYTLCRSDETLTGDQQ